MPARTPEEVPRLFAAAFGAQDLETALTLYEPDATLIPQPGQVVAGTEALGGLLALESKFDLEVKKSFQVDDVALLFSDWTLSTTGPDGRWLLVIDDPYGADHGFDGD